MKIKKNYVYPRLPAVLNLGFIRIGGSGLANCLFISGRSVVRAKNENLEMLRPCWEKFSAGPYLRRERDKRSYFGLFRLNLFMGIRKLIILSTARIQQFIFRKNRLIEIEGLGNYFTDILSHHELIQEYIESHSTKKVLKMVNEFDYSNSVGVHIRLGDYSEDMRVPLSWYIDIINLMNKRTNSNLRFLVFSDGSNEDLIDILKIENASRVFFGTALSDILALSRCNFILASDSTFSAWGAFLGQVPVIFKRRHFDPVLLDSQFELVDPESEEILDLLNVMGY